MAKVINRRFIERIKGEAGGVNVSGSSGGGGGMTLDVKEGQGTGNAYTEFTYENGVLTLKKTKTLVDTAAVDQTIAGNKTFSNTVVAPEFQGPSDERLKDIVSDIELTTLQVAKAPSKLFRWKGKRDDGKIHGGTIAQYWAGIAPWAVTKNKQGIMLINQNGITMSAVIAVSREVVALRQEVDVLKATASEVEPLRQEVAELKAMIQTMKAALQNQ